MEEAKTTTLIKVECTDQVLRLTQTPTIASGGVKEDTVEFAFDNLWDGFNLAAVFYCSEKQVYHVGIVDNRCIVPREVLANPGYFYLGVMGVKDSVTRTTNVLSYRVEAGAITEGVKPPEPTPQIYEQILASVKYAEQIAQSVRDDADAGKFNGDKGDPGANGAPGKDGKDGSDATVTAQNIEAALGYAPVKDVKVAGTSVMTDGVANVPIANKGGLGVSSVDDYSMGTTDAGVLFLYSSRNGDIDARSANIAVTPYNLDYAVKAAMCDGKGAAWTADEQKAARERMGVDKAYELIEEITTDGAAITERTQEPDGTPYDFEKVMVVVTAPKQMEASVTAYVRFYVDNVYLSSYTIFPANKDYFYRGLYVGEIRNSILEYRSVEASIIYSSTQDSGGGDASAIYQSATPCFTSSNITKVHCFALNATAVPAEFLIQIYGVRA